jgi:hypothetical protein
MWALRQAPGPSSESRQGRKAREVEHAGSACAMGIWLEPTLRRAPAGAASAVARRAERADDGGNEPYGLRVADE